MLDTNVLVSAFLWRGASTKLIERASESKVKLFTSRALLDKLSEVLKRRKFARGQCDGVDGYRVAWLLRKAGLSRHGPPACSASLAR
ncbi:MAG: putative toxin-antitoxin system toxin component, PIN family [Gammaproteobacteria bacterium]